MKIGIDARIIFKRGVGRYISNLLSNLLEIDKKNEYYIYLDKNTTLNNGDFVKCNIRRANTTNAFLYEQFFLPQQAQKDKVDILHSTDNTLPYLFKGKKLVTIHDTMFIRPIKQAILRPTLKQRLHDIYKKISVPLSARKADHIITVSEYSKADIIKNINIPAEKISVIKEGVDQKYRLIRDRDKIDQVRQKYGINKPYVLISAAADLRKNTTRALEAFKIFNGMSGNKYQLVITSIGEKEIATTDIKDKIVELNLEQDIIITYYAPEENMVMLYNGAFFFLFPSLWEGFGLQILEAFACGLPVITSNNTSLTEIAGDAAYFVDPFSVEDIVKGMVELEKNDNKTQAFILRGFKQADKFSWKQAAEKTLEIYKGLA